LSRKKYNGLVNGGETYFLLQTVSDRDKPCVPTTTTVYHLFS